MTALIWAAAIVVGVWMMFGHGIRTRSNIFGGIADILSYIVGGSVFLTFLAAVALLAVLLNSLFWGWPWFFATIAMVLIVVRLGVAIADLR